MLPAQAQKPTDPATLAKILGFEAEPADGFPGGWTGGPKETISVDDKVVHGGHWSARLERRADSANAFSVLTKSLPMDFAGTKLELRGFLRTENVTGFAGLWAREDGESPTLAFDNMQNRQLKGTTEWTEYTIELPVHRDGRQLFFGVLVSGTGTVWADDLQLLVDGKPIWEAPKVQRVKTAIESDHEFDGGSRVTLGELTAVQIQNLATLGKVWGFLKYHHPQITGGTRHWDYDLLRVLPKVLAATDRSGANQAMLDWVAALGPVNPCKPCATLDEKDIHLRPDVAWLSNDVWLGAELSKSLRAIYANRIPGRQFYVSRKDQASNPSFDHELSYSGVRLPDAGFQILALYRFWNIIEYWSPYRNVVGVDWNQVLSDFLPRIALSKNAGDYQRELMALIAMDHDTHANLWSSLQQRPPMGTCQLPMAVRFAEDRAVVSGYLGDAGRTSGLKPGDVILQLDGVPVSKLVETWSPYYAASNDPTRLRDIARSMTRGNCGEVALSVQRESEDLELKAQRVPTASLGPIGMTHDQPGETFRRLSDEVAYLKLSSVKIADVGRYIDGAAGSKGLIIDIRNYPSQFVVFALGGHLVDHVTQFASFTKYDLSNPGAFHWSQGDPLLPLKPRYSGKTVILVDEVSQSQAEYTTMAFRSAPGATVIGSTTAGADGNVSNFNLPGGLSSMMSGLGVFYPNKKPTQRVGMIPDVEVKPTIAGLRAGRDELMEEAIRQILGRDVPLSEIQEMIRK
jgi:C-terminal processing protease CtpA/Prc